MPRIFLPNFHFEHELANPRFAPTKKLLAINARNACEWLKIAHAGDVIALPDVDRFDELRVLIGTDASGVEAALMNQLPVGTQWEAIPWGWTSSMLRLAQRQRWSFHAPAIEITTQINSRRFAFGLESQTPAQPQPSRIVHSLGELMSFLTKTTQQSSSWLLKGEFGMSGRERLRLDQSNLSSSQLGWLTKEFNANRAIVVEPFLPCLEEVSVHYEILPDGSFQRLGLVELISDNQGQFTSATPVPAAEQQAQRESWQMVLRYTDQAAEHAARLGYFGPLGIDAMCYKMADGSTRRRPLQDINARWTMGRLALEASRLV